MNPPGQPLLIEQFIDRVIEAYHTTRLSGPAIPHILHKIGPWLTLRNVTVEKNAAARESLLIGALAGAALQLEYLDGKFPTGTTPAVLAQIDSLLTSYRAGKFHEDTT